MKIQYQTDSVCIFESSIYRTTTSLLIGEDYIVLIDPNTLPIEISFIENYITKHCDAAKRYLLFTHSDYDHIVGYSVFKDYTTIASNNFVTNKHANSVLEQISNFDDEHYIQRAYKIEYPEINIVISFDKELHTLGSDAYTFYQARGHNSDGIITYNKSKGILIVGDYLSNIEFPFIYDSFTSYKETLQKLKQLIQKEVVQLLIPGHGDATQDKMEMLKRVSESENYLKDLQKSFDSGVAFDLEKLLNNYNFPKTLTKYHNTNVALVKKEMEGLR